MLRSYFIQHVYIIVIWSFIFFYSIYFTHRPKQTKTLRNTSIPRSWEWTYNLSKNIVLVCLLCDKRESVRQCRIMSSTPSKTFSDSPRPTPSRPKQHTSKNTREAIFLMMGRRFLKQTIKWKAASFWPMELWRGLWETHSRPPPPKSKRTALLLFFTLPDARGEPARAQNLRWDLCFTIYLQMRKEVSAAEGDGSEGGPPAVRAGLRLGGPRDASPSRTPFGTCVIHAGNPYVWAIEWGGLHLITPAIKGSRLPETWGRTTAGLQAAGLTCRASPRTSGTRAGPSASCGDSAPTPWRPTSARLGPFSVRRISDGRL